MVALTDGGALPDRDGGWDRLLSTYVLDLLSEEQLTVTLAETHRVLRPGGLLCLAGLTHGTTPGSRLVMGGWDLLHRLTPRLVGGCRPIVLSKSLQPSEWKVRHHQVIVRWGIASEVLVAERLA